MKFFGREPVAILTTVEAALTLVLLMAHVSADTIGIVMAVVVTIFGLIGAFKTYETALGAVIGLLKAALALAIVFGFSLSPDVSAALITFVTIALGLFYRTQTTPVADGSFAIAA